MCSLQNKLFLSVCLIFNLFTAFLPGHSCLEMEKKTCADLELLNGQSGVEVIEAREDSYVNMSFILTTYFCEHPPDYFKVKVSTSERGLRSSFCTVVFQGDRCSVTDKSFTCDCSHKIQRWIWAYHKIIRSDQVIILEWTDSVTYPTYKEKYIVVRVHAADSQSTILPTIVGTSCGIVLAVLLAAVIIRMRRCKCVTDAQIRRLRDHFSAERQTTLGSQTTVHNPSISQNELHADNALPVNTQAPQENQIQSGNSAPKDNSSALSNPNSSSSQTDVQRQMGSALPVTAQGALTTSGAGGFAPPGQQAPSTPTRAERGAASYNRANAHSRRKRVALHRYNHLAFRPVH